MAYRPTKAMHYATFALSSVGYNRRCQIRHQTRTMNDPVFDPDSQEAAALAQAGMRAIFEWLDSPPARQAAEELSPLRIHLVALRETQATPHQRADALDRLYARGITVVAGLLPALADVALPVPRKTRLMVRSMQDLLQALAEDILVSLEHLDENLIRGLRRPSDIILWRTLHILSLHLLISDLIASPAGVGIWRQLHKTYATARHMRLTGNTPEGGRRSIQDVYYSALLLGCAQPASFTSQEIGFVASYLERFADCVAPLTDTAPEAAGVFWIDPLRDLPAFACSRKSAPPETDVQYFSCERIATLLEKQLSALEAGSSAKQTGLPEFAETAAGQGVLRRLAAYWGSPVKRRFTRRRQNYRGVLCVGLDNLWHLFHEGHTAAAEMSSWMITNESPDGYAVMHVSGKTGKLSVGDIAAIRTESGNDWQICIVRWALSENPEHLELGLQILATSAIPATLALQSDTGTVERLPVLILPEIPPLRTNQTLVVPSGALHKQQTKLVLLVEQGHIEVREVKTTHLDEQTSSIEVFSIQPDKRSC